VVPASAQAPASGATAFPTESELRAMSDYSLLNALVETTRQLDADLAKFDTGELWRSHLKLPADALPPPSNNRVALGLDSLKKTLRSYDAIAGDSQYSMISRLPSFGAARASLAESVKRFGARRAQRAAAQPEAPPQVVPQTPPQAPSRPLLPPQDYSQPQSEELPTPTSTPHPSLTTSSSGPPPVASPQEPAATPTLAAPTNGPSEQSILKR
jgi:hypothetical protein